MRVRGRQKQHVGVEPRKARTQPSPQVALHLDRDRHDVHRYQDRLPGRPARLARLQRQDIRRARALDFFRDALM